MKSADPKAAPKQARARLTIDRIMVATGEILDESGPEALTTTAIAARAGVNIASLYRYFEDREAVLREFAARWERQRQSIASKLYLELGGMGDLSSLMPRIAAQVMVMRLDYVGGRRLRQALLTSPTLRTLETDRQQRFAKQVAAALAPGLPGVPFEQIQKTSLILEAVTAGIVDLAAYGQIDRAAAEAYLTKQYLQGLADLRAIAAAQAAAPDSADPAAAGQARTQRL